MKTKIQVVLFWIVLLLIFLYITQPLGLFIIFSSIVIIPFSFAYMIRRKKDLEIKRKEDEDIIDKMNEAEKKEKERLLREEMINKEKEDYECYKDDLYFSFLKNKGASTPHLDRRNSMIRLCNCDSDIDGLVRVICKAHGVYRTCQDIFKIRKAFDIVDNDVIKFLEKNNIKTDKHNHNNYDKVKEIILALLDEKTVVIDINSHLISRNIVDIDYDGINYDTMAWVMGIEVDKEGKIKFHLFVPYIKRESAFILDVEHFSKITSKRFYAVS
ncbi:hypothetical protein CFI10_12490 [Marinobacterium iners]|uniref:hypothetical protein n=1 Tax=Marinobacterium iners TaxID=48076 RepID=UPI001A8D11C4|nr:hypothetical protein [Marinobacterium iners]QSR35806.1 hypothetical protein CFI10_12490 [Marinobacterium iners]